MSIINDILSKVESAEDYLATVLGMAGESLTSLIEYLAFAPMGNVVHLAIAQSGVGLVERASVKQAPRSRVTLVAGYLMVHDLPSITDGNGRLITRRVDVARRIASEYIRTKQVHNLVNADVDAVMRGYNTIKAAQAQIKTVQTVFADKLGNSALQDAAVLGDVVISLSRQFENSANAEAVQAVIVPQLEALADLFGKKLV